MISWTRPRALKEGDIVGVCAPAGPVDLERLERGVAELESLGFRVRVTDGARRRTNFTAGSAGSRLAELQSLFADEQVAAVVCARGGAGAAWLLPRLDADLLRAHPKVFMGYSDVTFVHLLFNRLGTVSFHGPMAARDLMDGSYDRASFLQAVTGQGAPYASEPDDLLPLRSGEAEGRLLGGCLSILAAAAGTRWALSSEGDEVILFLEDVDEPPYRIDRMLFQLRQSGGLSGVRGIVFGDMKGCSPSLDADYGLEEVILQALEGLEIPIALGLSSGHTASPVVTLPLGTRVRLACGEQARFDVLEAAVS